MATEDELLDAIAAIALDVDDQYVNPHGVYSLGGGGTVAGVKDLPDDIGVALPAFLVVDAGQQVIPGNWERTAWTLEATHWFEHGLDGERLRRILRARLAVRAAFRAKSKGNIAALPAPDPAVQSVLITAASRPETRTWTGGENQPQYLVVTYAIEVKVSRAVVYGTA